MDGKSIYRELLTENTGANKNLRRAASVQEKTGTRTPAGTTENILNLNDKSTVPTRSRMNHSRTTSRASSDANLGGDEEEIDDGKGDSLSDIEDQSRTRKSFMLPPTAERRDELGSAQSVQRTLRDMSLKSTPLTVVTSPSIADTSPLLGHKSTESLRTASSGTYLTDYEHLPMSVSPRNVLRENIAAYSLEPPAIDSASISPRFHTPTGEPSPRPQSMGGSLSDLSRANSVHAYTGQVPDVISDMPRISTPTLILPSADLSYLQISPKTLMEELMAQKTAVDHGIQNLLSSWDWGVLPQHLNRSMTWPISRSVPRQYYLRHEAHTLAKELLLISLETIQAKAQPAQDKILKLVDECRSLGVVERKTQDALLTLLFLWGRVCRVVNQMGPAPSVDDVTPFSPVLEEMKFASQVSRPWSRKDSSTNTSLLGAKGRRSTSVMPDTRLKKSDRPVLTKFFKNIRAAFHQPNSSSQSSQHSSPSPLPSAKHTTSRKSGETIVCRICERPINIAALDGHTRLCTEMQAAEERYSQCNNKSERLLVGVKAVKEIPEKSRNRRALKGAGFLQEILEKCLTFRLVASELEHLSTVLHRMHKKMESFESAYPDIRDLDIGFGEVNENLSERIKIVDETMPKVAKDPLMHTLRSFRSTDLVSESSDDGSRSPMKWSNLLSGMIRRNWRGDDRRHKDGIDPRSRVPVIDDFDLIKPISRGAFGKVYMAEKKATKDLYAIKILNRDDVVRKNMVAQVLAERQVMSLSKTPYVVRLFYAFENMEALYLVMEYMIGGDLSTLLQAHGTFPEEWVRIYMSEAITALAYLHSNGVIHRDIKPDNMLIDEHGHIKLTDFGLSSIMIPGTDIDEMSSSTPNPPTEYMRHHRKRSSGNYFHPESPVQPRPILGTPDYLAPELLLGVKHGPAVDWWALGICMYEFMYGIPPFTAESPEAIFRRIQTLEIEFPEDEDTPASVDAIDFIRRSLDPDPSTRANAKVAKTHPFFIDVDWPSLRLQPGPFVPVSKDKTDTSYFDLRNTREDLRWGSFAGTGEYSDSLSEFSSARNSRPGSPTRFTTQSRSRPSTALSVSTEKRSSTMHGPQSKSPLSDNLPILRPNEDRPTSEPPDINLPNRSPGLSVDTLLGAKNTVYSSPALGSLTSLRSSRSEDSLTSMGSLASLGSGGPPSRISTEHLRRSSQDNSIQKKAQSTANLGNPENKSATQSPSARITLRGPHQLSQSHTPDLLKSPASPVNIENNSIESIQTRGRVNSRTTLPAIFSGFASSIRSIGSTSPLAPATSSSRVFFPDDSESENPAGKSSSPFAPSIPHSRSRSANHNSFDNGNFEEFSWRNLESLGEVNKTVKAGTDKQSLKKSQSTSFKDASC